MIRTLRKYALIASCVALALGTFTGTASADGKVTWQNEATGRYLEVYHSSTDVGGRVDTWPWNGTDTQYWWDAKLDTRYWLETNWNSGLLMTAYNDCGNGIAQWTDGGWTTQEWYEFKFGSAGWELINHAGCNGDPYWDTLGQAGDGYIFLYPESNTTESAPPCDTYSGTPLVACSWR